MVKKSGDTQRKNGTSKGSNNPNANPNDIYLFNNKGKLIKTFRHLDINNLINCPSPRMIKLSLVSNKPMYIYNKTNHQFAGWHACYENRLFFKIKRRK